MAGVPASHDQPVRWFAGRFPLVPPCFPLAAAGGLELNAELQAHARHPRQAERGVHRSLLRDGQASRVAASLRQLAILMVASAH